MIKNGKIRNIKSHHLALKFLSNPLLKSFLSPDFPDSFNVRIIAASKGPNEPMTPRLVKNDEGRVPLFASASGIQNAHVNKKEIKKNRIKLLEMPDTFIDLLLLSLIADLTSRSIQKLALKNSTSRVRPLEALQLVISPFSFRKKLTEVSGNSDPNVSWIKKRDVGVFIG
jgi:hypothetical protein